MSNNENQSEILAVLKKHSFRQLSINMFIMAISFVIMSIVTLINHPILLPGLWLATLWGVVAGINIVEWALKSEDYLSDLEKKRETKEDDNV